MNSRFQFILFALLFVLIGITIGIIIYPGIETEETQKMLLHEGTFFSKVNIVAVSSSGIGIISEAEVEIREGKNRALFSINPFVEPDTQYSAETAKLVAEEFTGKSLQGKDVIYTIKAGESRLVGGPSAGAALCLATIAAIEGKEIRNDFTITGTIQENGGIGQIGGVLEKASAAAKTGIKLFLVPKGQSRGIFYEKKTTEKRGKGFIFQRIYYEPVEVDLNKAFFEEYGMQIIEVSSIKEALQHAFKP